MSAKKTAKAEKPWRVQKADQLAAAEVVVHAKTGAFELRAEGVVVAAGKWTAGPSGRRTIRVPLGYDPGVYFDSLVDRRRAEDRGDMLRTALETALRALDLAATGAPANGAKLAADLVRATLADPFEVSVAKEIAERREAEGRRRAAIEAEKE